MKNFRMEATRFVYIHPEILQYLNFDNLWGLMNSDSNGKLLASGQSC